LMMARFMVTGNPVVFSRDIFLPGGTKEESR
jgi:hypothetical protein